jgi:hypothetical protein
MAAAVADAPAIHVATLAGQAAQAVVDVFQTHPAIVPAHGQAAVNVVHGIHNVPPELIVKP